MIHGLLCTHMGRPRGGAGGTCDAINFLLIYHSYSWEWKLTRIAVVALSILCLVLMCVYFLQLLSIATFFGGIFCFAAFCFKSLYVFIALFAIGELLVFATQVSLKVVPRSNLFLVCKYKIVHHINILVMLLQGPVNFVCLHCVKPSLRPLSIAMSTVAIHIFGDVPSSPLVGVLQVRIPGLIFYLYRYIMQG